MKRSTLTTLAAALTLGLAVLAATPPANLPQALEAQRRLVADRPADAAAQNDLGNLLLLAGDEAGAEAAYESAVELAPDDAGYRYNLALLYQQTDRPLRALRQLERSFELDPTNAWAAYQAGAILEAQDRRRAAIEWYGRALRLDPDLAFPDVNPHVIESELIDEAMLRGYRSGLAEPVAPHLYAEPGRISSLLVAPTAPAAAPPAPPEERLAGEEPPRAATPSGGVGQARPLPGGPLPGAAAPAEPGRRVLTEEDLEAGAVNQAAPQGAPAYRPPTRRGGGTTIVVPGTVGTPDAAAPDAGRDDPRRPTDTPRQRTIVPRSGAPFSPGLPSTGSLDTVLVEEGERLG
ncbi:MAG TPA: hypothetical protein VF100_13605 [Thermoanaerobaculia bacterium]